MEEEQKVIYKSNAKLSIEEIAIYIAEKGYPDLADKFIERLFAFGDSLIVFPKKYALCRHTLLARRNLRCAVFENIYIFIYKQMYGKVMVYNVVHCKRLQ